MDWKEEFRRGDDRPAAIGIMGGTFDPIHYGHLVTAENARHFFSLSRVIFVPAYRPPHKKQRRISPPEHRLEMVRLAIASNPHFTVSDMEISRRGPSYTIDTVLAMQQAYPAARLFFITGADAVLEILSWHRVTELLQNCTFIAATRPGYQLGQLRHNLSALPEVLLRRILTMEVPALAISSTDIRQRVREGRPVKYLLPEAVEDYIYRQALYQGD
ncbi:nicotinate-nucleotide adenylyltransferase [Desulfurispora thermophila]|uniref:nicotinate-nucleotide adenylyltransferase n=1 Tax=Desulfurispora thermophila TaxID=265470 RepID=UPI000363F59A|nr:nicotinate-nucleotide adenylyltransferase [Desulfurispora thermophila]